MASSTNASTPQVGFVGLGAMGTGMASNLAKHLSASGRSLQIFNRDNSKLQPFLAPENNGRFTAASSLSEMATRCDIIFTMLAHDAAVKDVMGQIRQALADTPGATDGASSPSRAQRVLVDCSTVSPETTREMATAAEAVGALYLACPVLGRPDAAATASLLLFCAGPDAAREQVLPYLRSMGRKVLELGGEAPRANVMKLLANFHLVSLIELLAEGMTLAEKNGIARSSYMSFIDEILPSPIVHGYGTRMAADAFEAGQGFTVTLGLKDVNLMRKLAESSEAPLPLADLAFNHLLAARASGLADKDWSALALAVRRNAGIGE